MFNILVPTYPNPDKLELFKAFLESCRNVTIPCAVCVGITDNEELEAYKDFTSPASNVSLQFIVLEDYIQSNELFTLQKHIADTRVEFPQYMAVLKKFLMFHWAIKNGIEDFICLDDDCHINFIDKSVVEQIKENYKRRIFFGSDCTENVTFTAINTACQEFWKSEYLKQYRLTYTWYHDINYYVAQDVKDMFSRMDINYGSVAEAFKHLTWHTFEHVLYIYHLAENGATIRSYNDAGVTGCPESLTEDDDNKIYNLYGYKRSWIAKAKQNEDNYPITFHTDRKHIVL